MNLFTKVCVTLMNNNIMNTPLDIRDARQFDGRIIMSGVANAFPELLTVSLATRKELMETRELATDEVLDLVTPFYQVHSMEICGLSCYMHLQTDVDKMVLKVWDEYGESGLLKVTTKSPQGSKAF